jgi:peptidoglycan/LPS O-acetylase OafA/YrhL
MPNVDAISKARPRLPLVDLLRAVLATTIAWHHFVLYSSLAEPSGPVLAEAFFAFRNYRWIAQAFFVVGGYVMARSMSPRTWDSCQAAKFVLGRYIRLGVPYLVAIALFLGASAWGRGVLSETLVGESPTASQILAHVFFLQDILGYAYFSAGLWFVCIDFQLSLIYVAMLWLRDALNRFLGAGQQGRAQSVVLVGAWGLALASLFYFNVSRRWDVWAWHFFGQFFLGVVAFHATQNSPARRIFWLYVAAVVAALTYDWRWRLAFALLTGLLLYFSSQSGLITRWPRNRVVGYLGRTSYSLFLVHYPVFIIVASIWKRMNWTSSREVMLSLVVAYGASLAVAAVFFELVERPCAHFISYWRAATPRANSTNGSGESY